MKLCIPATIVMLLTTPEIKINAVKSFGAEVILHGVVDSDEICSAIKHIYQDTRSIAEPAGALAVPAVSL